MSGSYFVIFRRLQNNVTKLCVYVYCPVRSSKVAEVMYNNIEGLVLWGSKIKIQ